MFSRFISISVALIVFSVALVSSSADLLPLPSLPGCHAYESDCHSEPLANGRPGERVTVCERVKLVCNSGATRNGTTTVEHYGR